MATRIARPPFRRKTGLRISKGEAALEHAFKERDIEDVGDVATLELSRVPDIIVVPTLSQPVVIDIVVPAGDARALAEGWRALIAKGIPGRAELGRQAVARIESEYAMTNCVERYQAFYESLVNHPSP